MDSIIMSHYCSIYGGPDELVRLSIYIYIIIISVFLFRFANFFRWWLDVGFVRLSFEHIDRSYQILKIRYLLERSFRFFEISDMKYYNYRSI